MITVNPKRFWLGSGVIILILCLQQSQPPVQLLQVLLVLAYIPLVFGNDPRNHGELLLGQWPPNHVNISILKMSKENSRRHPFPLDSC